MWRGSLSASKWCLLEEHPRGGGGGGRGVAVGTGVVTGSSSPPS